MENEKSITARMLLGSLVLGFGLLLTGCDDRGPAEEAGAELDSMMEDAQRAAEDARSELEDAVDL